MKTTRKRRNKHKTDYGKRIKLLKSGKPRLVFRKSNKYVLAQYVSSSEAKDTVKFSLSSKKLLEYGWPKESANSLKSIPASYLLGYLVGIKIKKEKLDSPIIDFGMNRMMHGTRVFGFLKGTIDAGVDVKCKEEAFPDENRVEGKLLKNPLTNFEKIKSKMQEA